MARIYRDAQGVPHVRATSIDDLAHGQGLVTARDRAWQLEFLRRRATGTTAEAFGPSGVPWDRLARRTGIADTARRAHDRLTPETRAFVASYVAGVNDGLHADAPELEALGIEPAALGGVDPAGGLPRPAPALRQPARQAVVRPRPRGARRRRRPALARGSAPERQQRVGGRRRHGRPAATRSSAATRTAPSRAPASTSRSGSRATSSTSSGFAFPGVPGIQHFAHAGDVAWAITNAMADYQDVYAEQLRLVDGRVEALRPGRMAAGRPPDRDDPRARPRPAAGRDRDDGPRPRVLGQRRRRQRAQPARGIVGAGRPRLRRDPPAASRAHRRGRRPGVRGLGGAGQQRGDRRPDRRGALPGRRPGAGARRAQPAGHRQTRTTRTPPGPAGWTRCRATTSLPTDSW